MGKNLHVGSHKRGHPNYDQTFGVKLKHDVCRLCSTHPSRGGDGKCRCSLVKKIVS